MKQIVKHIPNALTLGNLLCGCAAVVFALQGDYYSTFLAVVGGALFDFSDGMAARLLKAHSPIGGELDSLADMVTFGVAPSMIMFHALHYFDTGWVVWCAFALAVGAALRLAKFNVDTEQTEEFRGLPTPAMALFFVSFAPSAPLVLMALGRPVGMWVCLVVVALFVALMTCRLPMFSLKFKSWGLRKNIVRYLFLLLAILIGLRFGMVMLPMGIISIYILYSLAAYYAKRDR